MGDHRIRVELDRYRVVCLDCPWFHYDPALAADQLRQRGGYHISAARPR